MYNVTFSGHGDLPRTLPCQSSGQESILDMVKRKIRMPDVKTNLNPDSLSFFLFKTASNDCLNVGKRVGALSDKETYTCEFRRRSSHQVTKYMRTYDANECTSNRNMGHFFVSLNDIAAGVTPFKNKIRTDPNMRLQVDFIEDESILEALRKDGRFDVKKLGSCGVHCDRKPYPLSYSAAHCRNETVQIYCLSKKKTGLPQTVLPLPHPDPRKTIVGAEPIKAKKDEDYLVTAGPSTAGLPPDWSTPGPTTSQSPASVPGTLVQLIEKAFVQTKTLDSELKQQLVEECDVKFRNFGLKANFSMSASQQRDLSKTLDAVGAIFKLNPAGYPQSVGTCFGTGTQYIMTNWHVYDSIKADLKYAVFVDFNFEKGLASDQRYELDFLLLSCVKMDFAILKLKERSDKLPSPCIFSTGATIMDPLDSPWSLLEGQCLHLIGHPNGQTKHLDLFCPVVTAPQDSSAFYFYALKRGGTNAEACNAYLDSKDPNRGMYQVSSFFEGSSGSPGILFWYGKKLLVVLHTRGLYLEDPYKTSIEQGVQFTAIVKYVDERIQLAQEDRSGQGNRLKGVRLTDIFPGVKNWSSCPMDIDN